jgi:hypothetical protein
VEWSNIPFEFKEINSFLIFHIKRWKPCFTFLVKWAILLRIWAEILVVGSWNNNFIDSTLRDFDSNKKSRISRNLGSMREISIQKDVTSPVHLPGTAKEWD